MTHPFQNVTHTASIEPLLDGLGTVFRTFADQDSGCTSYGLAADGGRWFVKTASTPDAVSSLRRAMAFHRAVSHPAIVPLVHSFTTDTGPVLVYPWMSGEVLYHPTLSRQGGRTTPGSPMARFRKLPLSRVHAALASVLSAHLAVERAGFVAVDFYDGCLLYDFEGHRMMLCDLDEYRPGPFTVEGDRLPGSRRYMAPEEFVRGAVIDSRTTVFNLSRALRLLLDAGDEEAQWRGSAHGLAVVERGTAAEPGSRWASVQALAEAWGGPQVPGAGSGRWPQAVIMPGDRAAQSGESR
ncbi:MULTISPECIES: serine/threonine-protein kinase [unclassified Streptomyces]|uniref:serine/threonine-protein kinase n=1 Tax=unclassified Streptomyces TaxID=2593676 RepID=UPI002E308367|nr:MULTISPECIES: serine/threonine-protein kinase [unclassified Streptomyces]WUC63593.1 serine/threonine-protein kinase [Streptomyces sp. NBC_00539]